MNIFQSFVLSIVEGITEFLPISSTGHLVLTSKILGIMQTEFVKTFEIAIQSGAIAAVLLLYLSTFISNFKVVKNIIAAFVPTALIGFLLYPLIKNDFIGNVNLTVVTLFLGGVFIILFERYFAKKNKSDIAALSIKKSLLIGVIQSFSVVPGVSRALATIIGGEVMGLSRSAAVEFSFLLAAPTIFAATGYDLIKSYKNFHQDDFGILIFGFFVSFIVAYITMKWFLQFVKKSDLTKFGIYRIIIAIVFLILG